MKHTAPDRRLARIVAVCVVVMTDFHEDGMDDGGDDLMVIEIHAIATWAARIGIGYDRVGSEILRPVADSLVARYGREIGEWLYGRFRDAFLWRPWQLN